MSVQDMFNGNMSPAVKERFDKLKDYMEDKGNHICVNCGYEMILVDGCAVCGRCGNKSCGE